ncbi:MAG: hypothetical protein ACFUZC_10360 [Chthoniobacteraceae bacterium]
MASPWPCIENDLPAHRMNKQKIPNNNGGQAKGLKTKLYNMKEIVKKLAVSIGFVRDARNEGAPFYKGKTHPKWICKWIKDRGQEDGRQ